MSLTNCQEKYSYQETERTEVMNVMRNTQTTALVAQPFSDGTLDILAFAAMLVGYAIFALACIA